MHFHPNFETEPNALPESASINIKDCVVFCGEELEPFWCTRFYCADGYIQKIEKVSPAKELRRSVPIILPGLINGHTHIGDSFLPDGATGMTLEEGFFRPNGYKYKQLSNIPPEVHVEAMSSTLRYMAATGTIAHYDFREQGPEGARRLRNASNQVGVDSVILGQINEIPFSESALHENFETLPLKAMEEYRELFQIADGISESTMNDLTDPAWNWLRKETEQRNKIRAIHCLENPGYRDTSRAITGLGDLERALRNYRPHIIVHLTVANTAEIELLANSGAVAVINPRANAVLGLPLPPIRDLIESGVPILLGTDNGLLNSPNMFAEMDFTYKLAKSQFGNAVDPHPSTILKMSTSNVRHLRNGRHHGFIGLNEPASFVVINGSRPHIRESRHVSATVVTRVTPEDIMATYRNGQRLHGQFPNGQ
jgi:cytosine/adenosine deaminase-related metal-dependent hydrolase